MNQSPFDDRVLGERYRIIRPLASGGMAKVFLAEDTRLQRQVAIKVIHPHLAQDSDFLDRFKREAVLAANLNHPNLVNIFDQGTDSGSPYLVMEYVAGRTLRDVLNDFGAIPEAKVIGILEQVLQGLDAAHRSGIVHRDIKPENVLLADDGRVKLSDFGLARPVSAAISSQLIGTAAYLAPELVSKGQSDKRVDVYAVGILAFELLTSQQPFTGETAAQVANAHTNSRVPEPSSIEGSISPDVDELVVWCTEIDPDERPENAHELLQFLRNIKGGLQDQPATPIAAPFGDHRKGSSAAPTEEITKASNATTVLNTQDATSLIHGGNETTLIDMSPKDKALPFSGFTGGNFWRWLVSTLIVVALAATLGWWFGAGPGALRALPDLGNRSVAAAELALRDLNQNVSVKNEFSPDVPQGKVIRSEPAAGSLVFSGGSLTLVVSLGPELKAVPNLIGKSLAEATIEITKAGFVFGGADAWFNDVAAGSVFDYSGSDSEKIPAGSSVNLKVSLGPIPSVSGITQEAAVTLLTAAGLTVDSVKSAYSDTVAAGQVISLVPLTQPLGANGSVELNVSKGSDRVTMPKVVGETIAAANSALKALGLVVIVDTDKLSAKWGIYRVKSASVVAGKVLRRGDSVTIVSR
ncbi:MAG: Stk1 family PASTA domain-containing Ser/Thr kinase [Microbacteriaceae bacterium]|nr:Stk1 family PASTA domain-containing Ser/Thr kinase [Microbacteriaceae bacterium]